MDRQTIDLAAEGQVPASALTFDANGAPIIATAQVPAPPAPATVPATPDPATAPQVPVAASAAEGAPQWATDLLAALSAPQGAPTGPAAAPPAVPAVHVAAEGLDYLRPNAGHSFVRDAYAAHFSRDVEAQGRLERFGAQVTDGALHAGAPHANDVLAELIRAAGTTANSPALIPPGYRADLYVDQVDYPRPLVDAVVSAPISDATPFTVPRWVSATGMTQDVAVEGTNPATGVISSETVTVTPKAVSGIYDCSRELVDSSAGGVAIDMIALGAMRESWSQQTETRLAAEINGAGNGTDVPLGASPTAVVALKAFQSEIIALANRRKRNPSRAFADALLYSVLATDNAADGRPLLPWSAYSTVNVAGRTEAVLGANIMGVGLELAWALTLHGVILERSSVYNFESPAQTFRWTEVLGPGAIRFALFGYQAARVLRPAGVTRITYTGTPTGLEGSSLLADLEAEAEAAKAAEKAEKAGK